MTKAFSRYSVLLISLFLLAACTGKEANLTSLTIGFQGEGSGSVTLSTQEVEGVVYRQDVTETFEVGQVIKLTASAEANSVFTGWNGDCVGDSSMLTCEVVMNANKIVHASFAKKAPLTVNLSGEGSGKIVLSRQDRADTEHRQDFTETFELSETVELTAVAADGSVFTGWDGDCSNSDASCQLVMDSGKDVRATFEKQSFTLTLKQEGTGTGKVRVIEGGEQVTLCSDTCEVPFTAGSTVTLEPLVDGGTTFTSWDGDCSSTSSCQLTMDAPKTVTAVFDTLNPQPAPYTLSVVLTGDGSGMVTSSPAGIDCGTDCEESFLAGTTVILKAHENLGSVFAGWQNCPSPSGSSCSVAPNSNFQVTAIFNRGGGVEKKIVVPIRRGSDDAEQNLEAVYNVPREKGDIPYEDFPANAVDIKSGDIDLTYNSDYVKTDQLIGLRFTDLGIPPRATITGARIQFTIDHNTSGYVKLHLYGQANPQAATFVHQSVGDISNRPRTSAGAVWEPAAWLATEGTRNDPAALTVDLAPIVQEVVNLAGWQQSSNGLVFIIQGDPLNGTSRENRRRATSFEDSNTESRLIVTYLD